MCGGFQFPSLHLNIVPKLKKRAWVRHIYRRAVVGIGMHWQSQASMSAREKGPEKETLFMGVVGAGCCHTEKS